MQWFIDNYLDKKPRRVLDIGSCDANATYKNLFPQAGLEYVGLDMADGPNVNFVPPNPYIWHELSDNSFDVVINGQAFEHIEFFWLTMLEMARVLRVGGMICLIAPRGFNRHRFPVDCWRFDADGLVALARWSNLEILHCSTDMGPENCGSEWHIDQSEDSFLIASKPADWQGALHVEKYMFVRPDLEKYATGFRRCSYSFNQQDKIRELTGRLLAERNLRQNERENYEHLLQNAHQYYQNSKSWRITKPLRQFANLFRKFK